MSHPNKILLGWLMFQWRKMALLDLLRLGSVCAIQLYFLTNGTIPILSERQFARMHL